MLGCVTFVIEVVISRRSKITWCVIFKLIFFQFIIISMLMHRVTLRRPQTFLNLQQIIHHTYSNGAEILTVSLAKTKKHQL